MMTLQDIDHLVRMAGGAGNVSPIVQRYARLAAENADFERAMIQLGTVTGGSVECVGKAFSNWLQTTVFPWRVAFDYCLKRAVEGKSLPFTIPDA